MQPPAPLADISFELMYAAPYANLFTNINIGKGSAPFGSYIKKYQDAAAYNTFWNIRTTSAPIILPPATWAPQVTFVNTMNAAQVSCGWCVLSGCGCGLGVGVAGWLSRALNASFVHNRFLELSGRCCPQHIREHLDDLSSHHPATCNLGAPSNMCQHHERCTGACCVCVWGWAWGGVCWVAEQSTQ